MTTAAAALIRHRPRPGRAVQQTLTIAHRNLMQLRADPDQLMDATIMPIIFTLLFVYVFGGAISNSRHEYIQYLLPGIMAQLVAFTAMATGVGLNSDFHTGVMDRFRSLPIARSAVLAGRIATDCAKLLIGTGVMLAFGTLLGFRPSGNALQIAAAMGLATAFGFALCWVSALIGLSMSSPQAVQQIGFLWLIPVQFGSSIFAPVGTMPGWLQAFVKANPTSLVADTCRGLLSGGPVADSLWGALAWIAGITAVAAPLAVRRYRKRR
ncbi:ABC transporter permease [Peterkaempfera bronchialis]|uniref:Transport permease protein n=1 Tax=Peterkaempfera bronchialis TaxID=2126346 RepID=A0A345SX78_9ACTN|nr:ABC transporter permease [Peterkaempfera bronchialis]AXI78333.1 ABC transporter permease [Peterkaempfera bronchialis]